LPRPARFTLFARDKLRSGLGPLFAAARFNIEPMIDAACERMRPVERELVLRLATAYN